MGSLADEVPPVLVVMSTVTTASAKLVHGALGGAVVLEKLFDRPSETASIVGIDCFNDQENRANLKKQYGSYKGCHTAPHINFVVKLGGWRYEGKPREEALHQDSQQRSPEDKRMARTLITQTTLPKVKINATR